MPIDSSIYKNIQTTEAPSFGESQARAMTLAQLGMRNQAAAQEMQDTAATRAAFARNTGPDGVVDRKGFLADLGQVSPEKALQYERGYEKMDSDRLARDYQKVQILSNLAASAVDQPSYERALQEAGKLGLDVSQMPAQFDKGLMRQVVVRGMSAQERMREKQLEIDAFKARNAAMNAGTPFQKEAEKKAAQGFVETQEAGANAQSTIDLMDTALDAQVKYSNSSWLGGTGPVASLGGAKTLFDQSTEDLDRLYKTIALEKMKTQFAGMSKAIDSDAERAFFMASQPSIKNEDKTNANIILAAKSLAMKSKAEAEAQKQYVDKYQSLDGYKSPVKGIVTTMVSPEGKMMLIPKNEKSAAAKQGFMDLDTYAGSLFKKRKTPGVNDQRQSNDGGMTPEQRQARIKELRAKMGGK